MRNLSSYCPNCHKEVTFSWVYLSLGGGEVSNQDSWYFKNNLAAWMVGECPSCKRCALIEYSLNGQRLPDSLRKIYPHPIPTPVDPRIPEKIKKDLEEAKICFSVNAINAAATMARRALQRACKEKETTKKDLLDQIDDLADKGVITQPLRELAHTIRSVGNDGAHPNDAEVDEQDAKEILELAEQFMEIVFVAPARVQEIKDKRKNSQ